MQAAAKLAQAAEMISAHPGALQLRLYQTLVEVSSQASTTIVFPVPIDLAAAGGSGGQQNIQAMMQNAVALAASEKTKQLGAASRGDRLPGVASRAEEPVPGRER